MVQLATIGEYSAAIEVPALVKALKLQGGHPFKKNNRLIMYTGGFCVVFPYENKGKRYAVRCWHSSVDDIQNRTSLIAEAINQSNLPYFANFEYVKEGIMTSKGMQPVVVMDWVDALPLKKFIGLHINNQQALASLAESFKVMVGELHKAHFAHGDLQHGNIMVRNDGTVMLVDYDSMYVPALAGSADEIKGLAGYQHPARWKNKILTENIDYFSELIIYASIMGLVKFPELWSRLNLEDSDTLLFSPEDISSPHSASIYSILSKDSEIKLLVDKILEFLSKKGLNELEPLESAVKDKSRQLTDDLRTKWADNGYMNPVNVNVSDVAKIISHKWS